MNRDVDAPAAPRPAEEEDPVLLRVEGLRVHFRTRGRPVHAVDGVYFDIRAGETVALVGESGSGKSVTALALTRLAPEPPARYVGGVVVYGGEDVLRMGEARLRALRGNEIAYVFQDPATALNPVFRVGWQIREALRLHRPEETGDEEVLRLLRLVGIPDPERRRRAYPHQLSGGMQQRVMIAMALACRPRLLVADEPTTALDVTIQAQILELLRSLQQEFGMALLLITHNLGLVADLAHRVNVLYCGRVVESGPVREVLVSPRHPYTQALLHAVPRLEGGRGRLPGIPGAVPNPAALPAGCPFHPRCPRARDECSREDPRETAAGGRTYRCHYPL
jgi:oligopeptide/dipeptide ABC transporter ATP-binding protein